MTIQNPHKREKISLRRKDLVILALVMMEHAILVRDESKTTANEFSHLCNALQDEFAKIDLTESVKEVREYERSQGM